MKGNTRVALVVVGWGIETFNLLIISSFFIAQVLETPQKKKKKRKKEAQHNSF